MASTTKARLENFKINMPLINALCTPGIKARHWEAMSVKVQRINKLLLDEVEQNIVICHWRTDELFAHAEGRGK